MADSVYKVIELVGTSTGLVGTGGGGGARGRAWSPLPPTCHA